MTNRDVVGELSMSLKKGMVRGKINGEGKKLAGQSSSVGVPRARKMVFNWSISLSPGRYGIRSISSAKMQPTDQMSTAEL